MSTDEPTNLRDVAQRASDRHDGARGRAMDRIAKREGLRLSYTTFDKILAGTYLSQPGTDTLDALAHLADMKRAEVYRIAGEPLPLARFADQLTPDADILDAEQRRVVLDTIRAFATQNRVITRVTDELMAMRDEFGPSSAEVDAAGEQYLAERDRPDYEPDDDLVIDEDFPQPPADTPEPDGAPTRQGRRG